MGAYNWVSLRLLAPLVDTVRHTSTVASYDELQQSQWWPIERLQELQSRRLHALVRHCYEYVPFYRSYMREAGLHPNQFMCAEDLRKLPVLTRSDVRRLASELRSTVVPGRRTLVGRTGGSTGEPLRFITTPYDLRSRGFARSLRAQGWCGYRLGDRSVLLVDRREWGSRWRRFAGSLSWKVQRTYRREVYDLSEIHLGEVCQFIESHHVPYLLGFPSALYLLALHVLSRGGLQQQIKGIIVGGEPLYHVQREAIRSAFGVVPLSKYSSNEVLDIASQCEQANGFHVAVEDVVIEVLDETGVPVPPGTTGRVVVTNLHNYAMPFVRYDLGDIGCLSRASCICGRGLPLLENLEGRRSDILLTPDGRKIPGIVLPWSFLAGLGVQQIQVCQPRVDVVEVRLVLDSSVGEQSSDSLVSLVRSRYATILGGLVSIEVRVVPAIAASASGKRAVVMSDVTKEVGRHGRTPT